MMLKILWMPTFRCQLNCPYCDYRVDAGTLKDYQIAFFKGHQPNIKHEIPADEWLQHLNRFQPYHLEISGGEPLMFPGLHKVVSSIPQNCTWAITSNSLITPHIEKMPDGYQCKGWTASYHFRDKETFLHNMNLLRNKKIVPRVTITVSPENHREALATINEFRSLMLPINVHPMIRPGFDWKEHPEEHATLEEIKKLRVNYVGIIEEVKRFPKCVAGYKYIYVLPDGEVMRCQSQGVTDKPKLGNITDPNFKLADGVAPCDMDCIFSCDIWQGQLSQKL